MNGAPQPDDGLVARCLPELEAFVRRRADATFRARESTADLVQSICREVLGELPRFEYRSDAEFRAFLFQLARNKLREKRRFHRQEKRDVRREVMPDPAPTAPGRARCPTPSQDAIASERAEALRAAMARLPDDYREVVAMARIQRLPHAEIAARMGRSIGSVRMLLGRAMSRLAVELGDQPSDPAGQR
jgi:RNA polymerase sigma-70 factor (ECF subfamily)